MTEPMIQPALGPLAAALAKAQMEFAAVKRDKTVTVQTKTGGSYSFSYAPLDTILAAVRAPLSANGLVLVQLLDDGSLVTRLLHDSGASLTGRIDLPQTADIQGLGSAITYLRRYAIQAMLGIAAEEDDDGNGAAGNIASPVPRRERETESGPSANPDGSLIGTVAIGQAWLEDLEVRTTPEGPVIGFRLKQGRAHQKVQARGLIASALGGIGTGLIGQTVTCWGQLVGEEFTPKGSTRPVAYQVLLLNRIHGATFDIPKPVQDAPHADAEAVMAANGVSSAEACGRVAADGLMTGAVCILATDHPGAHKSADGSWPR